MEEQEVKKFILDKFNEADNVKKVFDRRWYKNLLYTYGYQWIMWDEMGNQYVPIRVPKYKTELMVVANRIFTTIRSVINKLVSTHITMTAVPKSGNKDLALVCNKILNYVLEKHKNIVYEVCFDLLVFGKSFIKCVFDPDEGEEVGGVKLGDIILSHLTPFEVYIDPLATSIDTTQYVFIVKLRNTDYVYNKYGVEVKPSTVVAPTILKQLMTYYGVQFNTSKNLVVVKEFWMRPTKEYPNGLFCILANDEVIKIEENIYRGLDNEVYIPIIDIDFFVTNNQLYGTSLVDQLIPLQREYNRLRTDIALQERATTRTKWVVPVQSGVSENSITGEPGEKIFYDARFPPPQAIQGVPPSPELWQHLNFIKEEFDDIGGVHDPSRGRVPSGVRSYIAIAYLQEQDQSMLNITRQNLINKYSKLGYMILSQAKQFFIEERVLTLVGKDGRYELFKFNSASLSDLSETSIHIVEGSALPQSMIARQQFILSLWQAGLISNPQKVLELLEMPAVEIFEDTKLDERNANNENMIMVEGRYVEVQRSDNHQVHLQIHNNFLKENLELPPQVREIFDRHLDTHQKLVNLQLMSLQQIQQNLGIPQRGKKVKLPQ